MSAGDCAATIETGVWDMPEARESGDRHTSIVTDHDRAESDLITDHSPSYYRPFNHNRGALDPVLEKIAQWAAGLSTEHDNK